MRSLWIDPAIKRAFNQVNEGVISPYDYLAQEVFRTTSPTNDQYSRAKWYAFTQEVGASPYHWW